MNIFILSKDPVEAAIMQCDRHVCKMVLESTQMLCLALPNYLTPYKKAYQNHPCSKWTLASESNYHWLLLHAVTLSNEYTLRYGREHKCHRIIQLIGTWFKNNHNHFLIKPQTEFVQAMPDQYKNPNAVKAYRAYYRGEKARFAKWNNGRLPPSWW